MRSHEIREAVCIPLDQQVAHLGVVTARQVVFVVVLEHHHAVSIGLIP